MFGVFLVSSRCTCVQNGTYVLQLHDVCRKVSDFRKEFQVGKKKGKKKSD
jgi:hypothetical protein